MKRIPISGPSITNREVRYVAKAVREGWYQNSKKFITEFEQKFAAHLGVKHAMAVSSCSGALHVALAALGIKLGDEVVVPDITWIATAAPVRYLGATPVFADIESDTWCIDPQSIEKRITSKTKAIIPVHLYGNTANMKWIMQIAKKHNLFVVEDAAQAIGNLYYGKPPGGIGDFGCFSFHGSKLMTTGEGGILVTNSDKLYNRAKFLLKNQGQSPEKRFWHLEIGYKYDMTNMQAALGTVQLSRLPQLVAKKRKIFEWYKKRLAGVPGLQLNTERPGCRNTYWMVTVVLDPRFKIKKEKLMLELAKYNIESRPFFYPLSAMPPFASSRKDNPVAYSISPRAIHLPCGQSTTEKQVEHVASSLKKVIGIK